MKELRILLASLLLCAMTGSGYAQNTYELVTDASTLKDGDAIIITSGTNGTCTALSGAHSSTQRKSVSIIIKENYITTDIGNLHDTKDGANTKTNTINLPYEITLVRHGDYWKLKETLSDGDVYLNGGYKNSGGSNQNHLKAAEEVETHVGKGYANGIYTITISDYKAIIKNKNNFSIQKNSSDLIYGTYFSGQNDVYIYRKQINKSSANLTITKTTIDLTLGETYTEDIAYTTSSDGAMHFTSNNTGIATVDADGRVTAVAEGSTTITVSQDEGTSHLASEEQTITVNVTDSRSPAATITAISPSGSINVGDMGYFALTKTENDDSGVTYTYVTDDATILDVTSDGMYSGEKGGTANITVTATPTNLSSYKPVSVVFPFSVVNTNKTPTVITLGEDNASVTYGETYNLLAEITSGYEGDISYTISNPAIATIETTEEGYVITPLAVGTTTITFSAAETANYTAAEDAVFTLTILSDDSAPDLGEEEIFRESISNNGTGNNRLNNSGWYMSSATYIEQNGSNWAFRLGSANSGGYITTPALTGLRDGAILDFYLVCYNNNDSKGLKLTGISCTLDVTNISDYNNKSDGYKDYLVNISNVGNNPKIKFEVESSNNRVFIDNISIVQEKSSLPVTIAANKEWVTYCSPYVLDFTDDVEDLQGAYYVNGHDDKATTLTVTKIAGKVPAKTGLLLHVTPSSETQTIKLPIGDTGTPLSGNKLVGVLSPTYIEPTSGVNTNLGLAGGEFVGFNNAGIIGANKAYLQIPTSEMPTEDNGDAKLTIIIDDSDTAAIKAIENEQYPTTISMYNIAGQRVNGSYKGIVIHNGKKSVVK